MRRSTATAHLKLPIQAAAAGHLRDSCCLAESLEGYNKKEKKANNSCNYQAHLKVLPQLLAGQRRRRVLSRLQQRRGMAGGGSARV